MAQIQITERMLSDAGGWQVLKHAKVLVQTGKVISHNYTPPLLKGLVREGSLEYRAGLKIVTPTNIENICSCRAAREWGTICAHSVALGLAHLAPAKLSTPAAAVPQPPPELPLSVGEPADENFLRLHLVLAPNFPSGWERDQLVLGAEVESRGKRVLLNSIDLGQPHTASERDVALIQKIAALGGGRAAGMLNLSRSAFGGLLELMRGHPRVTVARKRPVQVSAEPVRPSVRTEKKPDGTLKLSCQINGQVLLEESRAWVWKDDTLARIGSELPTPLLSFLGEPVSIAAEAVPAFVQNQWPLLSRHFSTEPLEVGEAKVAEVTPEVSISMEGSLRQLSAVIQFRYGQRLITAGISAENLFRSQGGQLLARNRRFEADLIGRFTSAGFNGPDVTGHYLLRGESPILSFLGKEFPALQSKHQVTLGSRFGNVIEQVEVVRPSIEIQGSGENWFDLSVELSSQSGQRFSAHEIARLLQMGQNHVRLKNGKFAVFDSAALEELNQVIRDVDPEQNRPGSYRVGKVHAGYLQSTVQERGGLQLKGNTEWQHWTAQQLQPNAPLKLGPLESVLRPYQKQGVQWLAFLAKNRLGGILADDMGLGKTLQALTFLNQQRGPSLVVVPSSLVFNWRREAERFTPGLKVLVIEGAQRHRLFAQLDTADLVITSYALLRRDIDRYRSREFETVILDEANHIKNPDTQNAQAASALRAKQRFVLTGTPMENSVRDLWSLMNFALPGYLGSRNEFKERYEQPVSRGDVEVRRRLARRLRPVMLRRLKKDVASDLPERIEQVAFCDLSAAQAEVYRGLLDQSRRKIDEALSEKDQNRGRMLMLTALLRLRQACCDLRLLDLEMPNGEVSSKVELFEELLQQAIDGGHRVLVFSQFVSMLSILKKTLEQKGVSFCYLDGATKDRAAVVDRFQQNEDVPVFLMSLKAGGVGLNLSAADTVIHFDPWWNPAVEAQATDRAHRIGQKRVVNAYKLITRGTVEEKILNLQQKKREAIVATVESEEPLMTALSLQEIQELLS